MLVHSVLVASLCSFGLLTAVVLVVRVVVFITLVVVVVCWSYRAELALEVGMLVAVHSSAT